METQEQKKYDAYLAESGNVHNFPSRAGMEIDSSGDENDAGDCTPITPITPTPTTPAPPSARRRRLRSSSTPPPPPLTRHYLATDRWKAALPAQRRQARGSPSRPWSAFPSAAQW